MPSIRATNTSATFLEIRLALQNIKTHKFTETKVKKHQLKKKRATKYKEPKSQIKI